MSTDTEDIFGDGPSSDDVLLGAIPNYPVDALPRAARTLVESTSLPAPLVGGASMAALAAAIGPGAEIEVHRRWHERAIVWIANIAPRGAGKTPAQDLAFAPLRDHDLQVGEGSEILLGDTTLEALVRDLHQRDSAGTVDIDELSILLRGLGEYKGASSSDQARLLALWSGSPMTYTRVGSGGKSANQTSLRMPRPTLVICGGLQTELHALLGDEASGMRPRWLPHLAAMPTHNSASTEHGNTADIDWTTLLGGKLIPVRATTRTWRFDPDARNAFNHYAEAWKTPAEDETATVAAARGKADRHLARIALVFAEAESPADPTNHITDDTVHRAALIVEYTIDCWRALPEQGGFSLTRRDEILDNAIPRLVAWLEEHGGQADRRQLQRSRVAGARTPSELDQLLHRYNATHPGAVEEITPKHGGKTTTIVHAPPRRPMSPVSHVKWRSDK